MDRPVLVDVWLSMMACPFPLLDHLNFLPDFFCSYCGCSNTFSFFFLVQFTFFQAIFFFAASCFTCNCIGIPSAPEEQEEEEDGLINVSIFHAHLCNLPRTEANCVTMTLTNFSVGRLYQLWEIGAEVVITAWWRGGHQAKIQAFDAFFLLLYHYKRLHDAAKIVMASQSLWLPKQIHTSTVYQIISYFYY